MSALIALIKRNTKLFFKDKGMLFTSLVTPMILLVLYATFLANIYRESFQSMLGGVEVNENILDGCVGGQLFGSLLAVSCVTVAFCSNLLMVQDKVSGAEFDLLVSPVKKSTMAMAYYISTALTTLIIGLVAVVACLFYLLIVGWYLSALDVLLIFLDVFLLSMFGTALSSIVNCFLTSQGQISAVGTIVSAGYGFICGAYMPISQFPTFLQKIISFLPGTYGTALIRNHTMRGAFAALEKERLPTQMIEGIKDGVDCNLYFFGHQVDVWVMYLILFVSVAVLLATYVLINVLRNKKRK
ncbi:MAG: ABC transporter permease [Clostridia bacterium]|nr:ABC transporter permease [Clostridia bacterium]